MAGKGGGAWKVAYADFVTAMMAFFMVMWLIASGDKKLKEAIAQHFRDPFKVYQSGGANLPPRNPYHKERLIPDLEPPSDKDSEEEQKVKNANLAKRFRGDRTTVGGMVLFQGDSVELDTPARESLAKLVPLLSGKAQKIELCGHCVRSQADPDDAAEKTDSWHISYLRCRAVMDHLIEKGIPPQRLRLSQGGPYEPYSIGYNPDRLAYNARVEVFMLSETAQTFQGSESERKARFTESPAGPEAEKNK